MSVSDRDKKILLIVIPVVFVLAYWFVLLAPKREEATKAGQELTELEQKRDDVTSQAARLESAKASFARDYRDVVRLGKAIPSSVDMPSLIVQLDKAARGTGIKFSRIKAGERAVAAAGGAQGGGEGQNNQPGSGSGDNKNSSSGNSTPPAAGGSQPAQSQPGSAAQTATNTASNASAQTNANSQAGNNPTDTTTSSSSKSGGLPVGGGAGSTGGQAGTSTAPGLDSVPLEFKFDGSFFDLADFFHKLKRFVRVTNKDVLVSGRLMTIDGMKFASEENSFPDLTVEVKATVYLSPKGQGTTAGASPDGPSTTQSAAAPSGDSGSPAAPATPTATVTP